ncbi:MAG: 23S rRNA (adenine(2503)-C(2))-methyltransferase RlmN [Verrucomicrobiae bacterium]|nr:23S rRNA (adenine(2503)-C(2))-methyltransferase RlmN [Verrucomicrobiae bacterium]
MESLDREELTARLAVWSEPAYRADQILDWIYQRGADRFDAMSNLPAALRSRLQEAFDCHALKALRTRHSTDTTEKFLFELGDRSFIETVLIPATPGLTTRSDRHTVCVSTQVGCAYGCKFCASGLEGWKRNLEAGEIVDQVVQVAKLSGQRVTNLVIMGMGEPLANYENLLKALRILNSPWSLGIGARKITISTSGLAPRIRQLADEALQFRLAISLHGATDEVRGQIMPVNRKYPLAELMDACLEYQRKKGRMLTFEYILIDGVNDGLTQAKELVKLAQRAHAKVNLIPYNPVEGLPWKRPSPGRCNAFAHEVRAGGIHATLRTEKGTDIDAACGQLRLRTERESRTAESGGGSL